jgi:CBS domain-containing protein
MREQNIGAVLVTQEDHLRGLVSDRDVVVRALAEGLGRQRTTVAEVCSDVVGTVSPDEDVDGAVEIMREHAIRRLPVVEGDHPVGIVSPGDMAIERGSRSALGGISAARPKHVALLPG